MARVRLRVRELAQAQGLNMSQLQLRSRITPGTIRRYWYNTGDGKANGRPLGMVSLDELGILADLFGVRPGDLLTDEE